MCQNNKMILGMANNNKQTKNHFVFRILRKIFLFKKKSFIALNTEDFIKILSLADSEWVGVKWYLSWCVSFEHVYDLINAG